MSALVLSCSLLPMALWAAPARVAHVRMSAAGASSRQLETSQEPAGIMPPPRGVKQAGYRAPEHLRTWPDFTYAPPAVRREAVRQYAIDHNLGAPGTPSNLPPVRILLIGGPASGKGTIAPMLSQAFRVRVIGVGQLLRGEVRAGTRRGLLAADAMARGELLPDDDVLDLLADRLAGSWDVRRNGFLLDGFPRTVTQAEAIMSGEWEELRPDCVVVLDRPTELVKEMSLGRMTDSATGQTFHPVFAPPPEDDELVSRLVWRVDDVTDVVQRRVEAHEASTAAILATFEAHGVPLRVVDNARSEIATFHEVAAFIEATATAKLEALGGADALRRIAGVDLDERPYGVGSGAWASGAAGASELSMAGGGAGGGGGGGSSLFTLDRPDVDGPYADGGAAAAGSNGYGADTVVGGEGATFEDEALDVDEPVDIEAFCNVGEAEEACIIRYVEEVIDETWQDHPLLPAVRRCNTYDPSDYLPVLVGDQQVGWASSPMLQSLAPHLAEGVACELVPLRSDRDDSKGVAAAVGEAARKATVGVRLAPEDQSLAARVATISALVAELVSDGVIPARAVRGELQDVRPISDGFVGRSAGLLRPPPLRMERGAMIHFGIPSYGVHVNGYVRDPEAPHDPSPWAVWVGKRSMSKATYPGLLDQMVAGGQPAGLTFEQNVVKECEEEASLPPEVVASLKSTGLVSYRYTTRKGLSTKLLATYDVELPHGMTPLCGDGEVEEFTLLRVDALLRSVRDELPRWKPNSALVVVDFAMRHGLIKPDEPGYAEIAHLLRGGITTEVAL